jgi:hypothetical protein
MKNRAPSTPSVVRWALLTGALLALACGGTATWAATEAPRKPVVLWTGDDQWVRIERQDDPSATPNDHPAQLTTAAVANALSVLRIRPLESDTNPATQRSVFTREELNTLAPQVAAGLAKAGPRQDVTFSTIGSHPVGSSDLRKDPSVNAGRVFYQNGKINVIFGELQSNYRKRNVYGRTDQDFVPRRQGERDRASKQHWALTTMPGVELHTARADWVTIDPAVATSQTAAASAPQSPAASVATPPSIPAATGARAPAGTNADADLDRRLRTLKDLRDKGLISEEAYDAKVQELLSEL